MYNYPLKFINYTYNILSHVYASASTTKRNRDHSLSLSLFGCSNFVVFPQLQTDVWMPLRNGSVSAAKASDDVRLYELEYLMEDLAS